MLPWRDGQEVRRYLHLQKKCLAGKVVLYNFLQVVFYNFSGEVTCSLAMLKLSENIYFCLSWWTSVNRRIHSPRWGKVQRPKTTLQHNPLPQASQSNVPQNSNAPVWTYFSTTISELLTEYQFRFELTIRLVRSAYFFSIVLCSSILQLVFHIS